MKTNLIQTCLLAVVLLALPAAVQAQFNYTTDNGLIIITRYTGSGGAVNIPDTINGLSVAYIGVEAFESCVNLTSVTIPNSVTIIQDQAFSYCTSLTNVTIGDGVTYIGDDAFTSCSSLTTITVGANNLVYSSVDGVLFDKSQATLIQFPGGKGVNYTIPDGVANIGAWAFAGTSLTNVTIPDSATNIGDWAFAGCDNLTSIRIPESVTAIGDAAFWYCTGLTDVTIGSNVVTIGYEAFADCWSLTSVTFPNSVTSIGRWAFGECNSLTNVTIGNSVISIGENAFAYCYGLTSVTIPSCVANIGDDAFGVCFSLTAITVDPNNSVFSSVNGVLFDKSQTTLIQYPGGLGGSYTVPDSVTNIGDDAFYRCENLTNITLGRNVVSIGEDAFTYCDSLPGVYFMGNAPIADWTAFGSEWFDGNNMTAYYLPGTTGWADFFANTGRPALPWFPLIQTGDAGFGVRTNQFGFSIAWAGGQMVVVEACTNLANPVWSPVATNTLTGDASHFSDPQSSNYPARFYRLRSP